MIQSKQVDPDRPSECNPEYDCCWQVQWVMRLTLVEEIQTQSDIRFLLSTHKYNYFDSMSVDWLKISKWVHLLKFA